jgi:hypothetical protein
MTSQDQWVISGPSDPDVIACGHSHVIAMELAVRYGLAAESLRASVCYAGESDLQRLGADTYWDFVVEQAPGRTVAVFWNGNQHNADFLIESQPPVRVVASEPVVDDDDATWVPQEMLRARWRPTNDELEHQLSRLVAVAREVLVVGTPPPKQDEFVAHVLSTDLHFTRVARELGLDVREAPVTPGPTRLTMWSLVQEMLAESAGAAGATWVPVPDTVLDDEGYLRQVLAISDATHANAAHGYLVWKAIEDVLEGSRP